MYFSLTPHENITRYYYYNTMILHTVIVEYVYYSGFDACGVW